MTPSTEILRRHKCFRLKHIIVVACSYIVTLSLCSEGQIPVRVNRRLDKDLYFLQSEENNFNCEDSFTSYLVDERRCTNNSDLINSCTFVIVPDGSHMSQSIYVSINDTAAKTALLTSSVPVASIADAMVAFRDLEQQNINPASECHILGLWVYRGKSQIISISHDGFNIVNGRAIEIDMEQLSYDTEEFKGELFRLNLTCNEQNGCLFLKIQGNTDITNAKFGGKVPGTIMGRHTTGKITTLSNSESAHAESTAASDSRANVTILDIATYAIIAIAGFLSLLFATISVSTVIFFNLAKDKKRTR